MSKPAAPFELLASLAAVMRGGRIRWYLFGAQAAVVHGSPRMTADVDVTARIEPERVPAFLAAMRDAGFLLRVKDPAEFIRRARVLPFEHAASGMPLDVVLAGPGLEEEFLDRARTRLLGGTRVPVLSAEDLVVTKLLAGRPKDLEDIRAVLGHQGAKLDLAALRATLGAVEEALDQGDLLPALEALLKEASPRRGRRRSRGRP